jgi:hypothetical protein
VAYVKKTNGSAVAAAVAAAVTTAPVAAAGAPVVVVPAGLIPWTFAGFKLEGKRTTYTSDDKKTETTRIARAICKLNGSTFFFLANITHVKEVASGEEGYRVSLPSTGRGFFTSVLSTDDNATKAALDTWKDNLLRVEFTKWYRANKGEIGSSVRGAGGSGVVKLDLGDDEAAADSTGGAAA